MLFYFILSSILLISTYGGNIGTNLNETHKEKVRYKENVTLVSEGGSIVSEKPILTLPENHTLLSLDNEFGKNKEKPIVPRKGVHYNIAEENIEKHVTEENSNSNNQTSPDVNNTSVARKGVETNKIVTTSITSKNFTEEIHSLPDNIVANEKPENKTLPKPTMAIEKNVTKVIKKPLILSNDDLPDIKTIALPQIKTSSKTIISDQMQSPNHHSSPIIKTVPMSASRHPGMIMPVVVTILVVPMFAILGYMALRRGQEAWKNRHYKRMDFLLDGMYND